MNVCTHTKPGTIQLFLCVVCLLFIVIYWWSDSIWREIATVTTPDDGLVHHSVMHMEANTTRGIIKAYINREGFIILPNKETVARLSFEELEEIYHRYVENIQVPCRRMIHLGKENDGGYHVCEDHGIAPGRPCLVYSFGCRKDFSFDDELSLNFGCEIHTFDPSDGQDNHMHTNYVEFHKLGLSGKNMMTNKQWELQTLDTIRNNLYHDKKNIDVLKIDIEYSEWASLEQMLETGALTTVKQLIVELHMFSVRLPETRTRTPDDIRQHLNVLRGMYDLGFRIFHFRMWSMSGTMHKDTNGKIRTGCHEVHFMNINYKV